MLDTGRGQGTVRTTYSDYLPRFGVPDRDTNASTCPGTPVSGSKEQGLHNDNIPSASINAITYRAERFFLRPLTPHEQSSVAGSQLYPMHINNYLTALWCWHIQVCDALEDRMIQGGCLVDHHTCDFFPER